MLTDGLDQSIDAANAYAAEHLEIQTKDADAVVKRIKNAGAIFRGPYSPVPLGDYMSGVQPRAAHRRHRPLRRRLGVHTFMKPVEVIEYDEEGSRPSPPASTPSRYPRTCRPRRVRALPLRQGSV